MGSKPNDLIEVVVSVNALISVLVKLYPVFFTEGGALNEAAIEVAGLSMAPKVVREALVAMTPEEMQLAVESIQTGTLDRDPRLNLEDADLEAARAALALASKCVDLLEEQIKSAYIHLGSRLSKLRESGSSDYDINEVVCAFNKVSKRCSKLRSAFEQPMIAQMVEAGNGAKQYMARGSYCFKARVAAVAKDALLDIQGLLEAGFDSNIKMKNLPAGTADTVQELARLCAEGEGKTVEDVIHDVYPLGEGDDEDSDAAEEKPMTTVGPLSADQIPTTDPRAWSLLREFGGNQYWQHEPTSTLAVVQYSDTHPVNAVYGEEYRIVHLCGEVQAEIRADGFFWIRVPLVNSPKPLLVGLDEALWLCSITRLVLTVIGSEGVTINHYRVGA